jgi:hypothetical protein
VSQVLEVDIRGAEVFEKKMRELGEKGPEAVGRALYTVGLEIFADSQMLVPVDTGALKGSGGIEGPYDVGGGVMEVLIYYGGPGAAYALSVHENLDSYHEDPTQAKYLEVPFLIHAVNVNREVANEMAGVVKELSI